MTPQEITSIARQLVGASATHCTAMTYSGPHPAQMAEELVKLGGAKGYSGNDLPMGVVRYQGRCGSLIWEVAVQMIEVGAQMSNRRHDDQD